MPPDDERLQRALEAARTGRALERRRDLRGALELYRDARRLLEDVAPTPLLANILRWEGSVLRDQGDVDEADERYLESLQVADVAHSLAAKAAAINCRAVLAQRRGDTDEAEALYRQAARVANEAGEIRLAGMIRQNLGVLANIRGDLEAARAHYAAAHRAFEEVGDDEAVSWVLNNIGMLLNDMRLPAAGETWFLRGLALARSRRDRPLEGTLLSNYAESLIAMERWDEARKNLEEAFAIAFDADEPGPTGEVLKFQGILEREQGRFPDAMRRFDQAHNLAISMRDRLLAAEVLRERGELHRRLGDVKAAMTDWTEALSAFRAIGASLDASELQAQIDELTAGS